MTVVVNLIWSASIDDADNLITFAAKNCKGFRGAVYKHNFDVDDAPLEVQFYFDNEENAIIFNLRNC
jgi:hypothetical protein